MCSRHGAAGAVLAVLFIAAASTRARQAPNAPAGRAGGAGRVQPGVLSTGGGLVFPGDPSGNPIAFEARTGAILWHASLNAQLHEQSADVPAAWRLICSSAYPEEDVCIRVLGRSSC